MQSPAAATPASPRGRPFPNGTSFLTPPFGYALFYLRAIAPKSVKTSQIIIGVLPFIGLILIMCLGVAIFPQLVTWLPETLYTK